MKLSYIKAEKSNPGSVQRLYLKSAKRAQVWKKRIRKRIRMIFIWSLISILWQISFYYILNQKINQVINPDLSNSSPLTSVKKETDFTISSAQVSDPSVSYDDRFLVFRNGASMEIYDFNQQKVIWQQAAYPSGRLLAYKWLPDRDSLIFFVSGIGSDPEKPHSKTLTIHSIELDSSTSQADDRFTAELPYYLENTKITDISLSTVTNLLYFCSEQGNRSFLYELDVMKNVKLLNHSGEDIEHLAVSPNNGALYFNSNTPSTQQIMALNSNSRVQVASNPADVVLGLCNQKVYLGTVEGGNLVKIWTTADNQPSSERPNFDLYWEGKIPWNSASKITISNAALLIYSEKQLHRITLKGTDTISHSGTPILSQSGNYYWLVNSGSANLVTKG